MHVTIEFVKDAILPLSTIIVCAIFIFDSLPIIAYEKLSICSPSMLNSVESASVRDSHTASLSAVTRRLSQGPLTDFMVRLICLESIFSLPGP